MSNSAKLRRVNPAVVGRSLSWLCLAPVVCALLAGCSGSAPPDKSASETKPPASDANTSQTTLTSSDNPSSGQDSPADNVLRRMAKVYRDAKTYADAGVARMQYQVDGKDFNQEFPFSVSFQRPNKLRMQVYEGLILSDGKRVYGVYDDVKGYVVAAAAPAKLTPEDVYADEYLRVMLTQRQVGAALQIMFLMTDNAVDMLLSQANVAPAKLLKPEELDGQLHDRVELTAPEGAMVFWVDRKTSLLRRVEYPVEGLRQFLQQEGNATNLAVVADFVGAQVNRPIDPVAFQFETPPGAKEVKRFVGPTPPEILGKTPETYEFVAADGEKISRESLLGKVVVLDFWATWCQPCLKNMPNLARVREKYKDEDSVRILPINIEGPEVTDETVKQALANLKLDLPVIRDPGQCAFKVFDTTGIPTMYVLGADGKTQFHQMGSDPAVDQVAHLTSIIDAVLAGEDMAKKTREDFERSMMEAPASIASAGNDSTPAIPEESIAEPTQPEKLTLQELWNCESVERPGNIYLAPQPQGPGHLYVIDDWQSVVELDQQGKLIARHELSLPEGAVVAFMRTAVDGKNNRFFVLSAVGQQTAHVFDQNWQRVLTYPVDAKHPGIFDVQLADLDGDGQLRLLVSYLDVVGVQCVSLQGERVWSNRSLRDVFSMAVTEPGADGKRLVLCANSQGILASLNFEGKRGKDLTVQGQFVRQIIAADLNGDGKNQYAGIGLSPTGADDFLGVGASGAAQWTYKLPAGRQHPAMDQVSTGRLLGQAEHWIVAAPDGSLHLVSAEGVLLDRFNTGAVIDGFAATQIDGKPALLISSENGLKCWSVEAK